ARVAPLVRARIKRRQVVGHSALRGKWIRRTARARKVVAGRNRVALDNPDQPIPSDPKAIVFLFILVSGIAPLVEESVKPLAVVAMVGRIRSAAEAFILGMAAGVGFDLVETIGYISSGYDHWLNIALQRSSAGLLHGFGAGMVALGWYYATHANSTGKMNRALVTLGCWTYAILQHAIWNGSFGLQLLPAPIGPYLDNGTIVLGTITVPSFMLVYIVETILMLIFFLFITKKLRTRPAEPISPAINKG
ncbi:MAG: PrsW family intramembrane metalloprotease, partial [Chloroflexi bacterium]